VVKDVISKVLNKHGALSKEEIIDKVLKRAICKEKHNPRKSPKLKAFQEKQRREILYRIIIFSLLYIGAMSPFL